MATRRTSRRRPNILLIGIDSLRADRMSSYGYHRLTTPHMDRFAKGGALFERTYSPHIPTTSGYGSMLTGMDCFSNQVVALRHKGPMRPEARTLAQFCKEAGYNTTSVGFSGNPASRDFDTYLDFTGWGSWEDRPLTKAQNLNDVGIPELDRLAKKRDPFFMMLRHMDPHSPYLPPAPFQRMFYHGNEKDRKNQSMKPVFEFKPFRDFFTSWMPPGVTDKDYIIALYDGAVAYMDACIQTWFTALAKLGILDNTVVVINSDHGETLYDHDCFFDHHGLYDNTLHVPLIIRYPGRVPAGVRVAGYNQHKDLLPTILELAEIDPGEHRMDGRSLVPMARGEVPSHEAGFYITECTWMRKHGWRTPQWKYIEALEPDWHWKPGRELYNLVEDPEENNDLAEKEPEVVAHLKGRMESWIAKREQETGLANPMYTQGDWHGVQGVGPFETSEQAYNTLYIGGVKQAVKLQAEARK